MSNRQLAGAGIVICTNILLFGTIGACIGFKVVITAVSIALLLAALIAFGCYLMEEA